MNHFPPESPVLSPPPRPGGGAPRAPAHQPYLPSPPAPGTTLVPEALATTLIAMSGSAFANIAPPSPDFHKMALELGAAYCLRKPFSSKTLLAAVNECLKEPRAAPRSP